MVDEKNSLLETGQTTEEALLQMVREKLARPNGWVYAVLSHEVVLGQYDQQEMMVRGRDGVQIQLAEMVSYLQELRVFNADEEFRAIRISRSQTFRWRLRNDSAALINENTALDENHKLWGSAKEAGKDGWTCLQSDRGSCIWVPMLLSKGQTAAVKVRNYLEWPDATDGRGLIRFADERLCGFELWQKEVK